VDLKGSLKEQNLPQKSQEESQLKRENVDLLFENLLS
jgi:hypothetical protein